MKIKSIVLFLTCLLLLSSFTAPATACCEPPAPPCHHCEDTVWVYDCDSADCESCVDGSCKVCDDDPNKVCCNGSCCDTSQCNDCSPTTGDCEYQCHPCQHCENGTCVGPTGCWTIENVPRLDETCEACSGFFTGCGGIIEIRNGYAEWRSAGSGEGGWCKNPTKLKTVGFLFDCTEDWDTGKILTCAAGVTICVALCEDAETRLQWAACVGCLLIAGIECALDGACAFVESCIPGDAISPVQEYVIDGEEDWGDLCSGG